MARRYPRFYLGLEDRDDGDAGVAAAARANTGMAADRTFAAQRLT